MITLDTGSIRFTYRVAGIAMHEQHVLLQYGSTEPLYFPPGGRAELLETTRATLRREMREELGIDIQIERLLWVNENFFMHRNKAFHEVSFYFLMTLPNDPRLYVKDQLIIGTEEDGQPLLFAWVPLARLAEITLYPTFLRTALHTLPDAIEHIVHVDEQSIEELRGRMTA